MKDLVIKINENLELRLLKLENAEALFALTDKNRDSLRQWLPWLDFTKTAEDSKKFIEMSRKVYKTEEQLHLSIWWKGQLAGMMGFHYINKASRKTNIGYWLGAEFQGNGIMTLVVKKAIEYGFEKLNLNRIEILCATQNTKSRGIAERLGFKHEGTLRDNEWLYDHFEDHEVYSLLKKEWYK